MASLTNNNGLRTVQFVASWDDGKRRSIRLGRVSETFAKGFLGRVELLAEAKESGDSPDADTLRWVKRLADKYVDRLANAGLIEPRKRATLGEWIDSYVASRTDTKPATREIWRQGKASLIEHFGASRPMRNITPGDADAYVRKLTATKRRGAATVLAPMTVRKRLQFAKTVFRAAVRSKLIDANPFDDVSVTATMPDRKAFISRDATAKLLVACPDANWRTMIALARYGGLRCPSEVLSLRLSDIDWAAGRIVVQSPKTEHHPGRATRTIPLFRELRPALLEAAELAPEGAVYVVGGNYRQAAQGAAGWRNCNLRTQFERIIKRAGLTPWRRLWHNLRASRATELATDYPAHVATAWLGHSEAIAERHYWQVTDADFDRAVADPTGGAKSGAVAASGNIDSPEATTDSAREYAGVCDSVHVPAYTNTDGEGFEPPSDSRPKRFSRPPPSTTRPPIREGKIGIVGVGFRGMGFGVHSPVHFSSIDQSTGRRRGEEWRAGRLRWPGGIR